VFSNHWLPELNVSELNDLRVQLVISKLKMFLINAFLHIRTGIPFSLNKYYCLRKTSIQLYPENV
jgi:hypothetical protein